MGMVHQENKQKVNHTRLQSRNIISNIPELTSDGNMDEQNQNKK